MNGIVGAARDGIQLRGLLKTELYAPARISDPEKFTQLIDRFYRRHPIAERADHRTGFARIGALVRDTARRASPTVRALAIDTRRGLVRELALPKKYLSLIGNDLAKRCTPAALALLAELEKLIEVAPELKWSLAFHNLVTTAGRNHIGDTQFTGSTQVTTWYVMLISATPTLAAGDTMASHSGWTKFTAYDESAHQAWVETRTGTGVWDNSGSVAAFTVSTNSSSIGGCALTSQSSKSTDTGTLYSEAAFSGGNKAADDNDVLEVTYTQGTADDGV